MYSTSRPVFSTQYSVPVLVRRTSTVRTVHVLLAKMFVDRGQEGRQAYGWCGGAVSPSADRVEGMDLKLLLLYVKYTEVLSRELCTGVWYEYTTALLVYTYLPVPTGTGIVQVHSNRGKYR